MFAYLCLGTHDMDSVLRFYAPVMGALGHQLAAVCRGFTRRPGP